MGVEVIQHHSDLLCFGVSFINQPPHLMGEVNHGAAFGHVHVPPARQGLAEQEQVAGPITFIFIVKSPWSSRLGRDRKSLLGYQLLGGLVETDNGALRVVGLPIKVQHIFHARHKLGAYLRDAPFLLLPRFEFVFFSTWRIVSREMESASFSSTT